MPRLPNTPAMDDPPPTLSALRARLAGLPHSGRMRAMVGFGRVAREMGGAGEAARHVLVELAAGGFFERSLALQACHGTRDGAHVLRMMRDPSRMLRARAVRLAPKLCDEAQMAQVLRLMPRALRTDALRKGARRGAGDAYLAAIETEGDRDALRLMPYGSAAFVAPRLAAGLADAADAPTWARLGRRHPVTTFDRLMAEAEAATGYDARLAYRARAALPGLSRHSPERALVLVDALAAHIAPSTLALDDLARSRPQATADLILARSGPGRAGGEALRILAGRLGGDPARLSALVARFDTLRGDAERAPGWMKRLPPEGRRAAYAIAARSWRDPHDALPPDLLALLPRGEREAEARRNWDLAIHATRPPARLRHAGLLPWDEACGLVDRFLRDPDAALRGQALAALSGSIRFDRGRIGDLLALIGARGNEQDPVRLAMIDGLARLPPSLYGPDTLASLTRTIRQALDATDLSHATTQAAERLAVRLLPFHPDWSAASLALLMRERGTLAGFNLFDGLSEADIRRLGRSLWPVVEAWAARERDPRIVLLARQFARRLTAFDDLTAATERLAESSGTEYVAREALSLLARHRRDRFAVLVPKLLARDPSYITLAPVQEHLHTKRQDLLDPYLGRTAWAGRFSTGRTRYVLPIQRGFERWLPEQQAAFARTLREVVADGERDSPAVLASIDQLAALPDVPADDLVALASLANTRLVSREAALRALARRDSGDGLDTLVAALGDARGRIAVHALRRALRDLPEDLTMAVLRAAPRARVTVFKEILRLLGEQPGAAAYALLIEIAGDDGGEALHRDVRVALLRALWTHLDRDETWPILERAAASPDAALAKVVGRIPAGAISEEAGSRLCRLVAGLLAHPDPLVRLDGLGRVAQMPLPDRDGVLFAPVMRALGSDLPDEVEAAARAIVATAAGRRAAQLGAALPGLIGNRRALVALTGALCGWLRRDREQAGPTARAVLDGLAPDPLTIWLRIEIALAGSPPSDWAAFFRRIAADDTLQAGALAAAVARIEAGTDGETTPGLEAFEADLAPEADARLRRLALAALIGSSRGGGWSEERRARLMAWRADPSGLVAQAAQFTFVPD